MKDRTFGERLEIANDKYHELMHMVFGIMDGEDINPNRVRMLIHDIYKDEVELIEAIEQYELKEREKEKRGLEIPNFMIKANMKKRKRA